MSSADVRSLERLEQFLQYSQSTRSSLLKELDNLQLELRRLTTWLENDATKYWADELQKAQRHWRECEEALMQCRSAVRADEQRPCTEQRKRLELATQRRGFCERQVRLTREAQMVWNRELAKVNSKLQRCRDVADSEMQVGIFLLREQIERLNEYARLRSGAVASFESTDAQATDAQATDAQASAQPQPSEQSPSSSGTEAGNEFPPSSTSPVSPRNPASDREVSS